MRSALAQTMYARLLSSAGLDKIVFPDEKMFRFGESGLTSQNCRMHAEVLRKDLKPSMVALEGDKFIQWIVVHGPAFVLRKGTTKSGACGLFRFLDSVDRGAWPFFVGGYICLVYSVSVCAEKKEEEKK